MNLSHIRESGKATGTGKRRRAKIISADTWGSSMYYPAEVLARDAATAFPVGTRMFEDHFTEAESWERPVGVVGKLVGKLISEGQYEADNPEGPGVYADVEFYDSYVDRINEIGDDIGLSVDGAADYVEGERDGRIGRIATGIPFIRSVDVVVAAGAGGKLISILESAGPMAGRPINTEGEQSMTALTKEDFDAGLVTLADKLGEKFTAAIQESLAPQATEPAAPEAPAATEPEAPAAPVQEPAEPTELTEPEEPETVEVDVTALIQAISDAGLPSEVVAQVVAAVKSGTSVEDAVKEQTAIKEAYLAQTNPGFVRIVESDRQDPKAAGSLRDRVLANVK